MHDFCQWYCCGGAGAGASVRRAEENAAPWHVGRRPSARRQQYAAVKASPRGAGVIRRLPAAPPTKAGFFYRRLLYTRCCSASCIEMKVSRNVSPGVSACAKRDSLLVSSKGGEARGRARGLWRPANLARHCESRNMFAAHFGWQCRPLARFISANRNRPSITSGLSRSEKLRQAAAWRREKK